VSVVEPLNRTLEQELNALLRGASLECLVCGEFVLRRHGSIFCPECGSELCESVRAGKARTHLGAAPMGRRLAAGKAAGSRLQLGSQAG
jgi:uncharacterized Zn finger protein (UPF0148 family)